MVSNVHGVLVLARNGDRKEYYQDPKNYAGSFTETTALGAVQSHKLGALLRSMYFDPNSPSSIQGMRTDLVDNSQVHVRVKAGGEGTVVFDSAIALLQALFPPTPMNKIDLANGTTILAPLGGYQYVPVETVEPGNDRSLESWTDCPAFERHIAKVYGSTEFKAMSQEAQPFFRGVRDFIFGRPATLENIWNIYDFINSELTHNKTYAYRLPPTYEEQAQALANYHENAVFSDSNPSGIGNIAGRTLLHTILSSLERIAFNGDPLQFLLIESTYQPFISLFHQTGMAKSHPELQGIPNYASALAIELRRGPPPDTREFLRFRFKNGTDAPFKTVHVFEHNDDIPLTEFIYRIENSAITSNQQWERVCSSGDVTTTTLDDVRATLGVSNTCFVGALVALLLVSMLFTIKLVRRYRSAPIRLEGEEAANRGMTEKTRLV